ncbi:MAG: hypothetical protein U5J83_16755 [Bryobacterales bacterium]|nr:hypothetical protein [Bryobacterales bacterium]
MSSTNKTPLEFTNANPDAEPKLRPMEPRHKDFLFYVADRPLPSSQDFNFW